jgi:hypothetical protein
MTAARIGRDCRRLRPQRRSRMHRTAALASGTTRASGTAIITARTTRAGGSTIVAATLIVSTRTGRTAGTAHQRLSGAHGTGINRTSRNRARRTRRHSRARRRRSAGSGRTGTQSRHHVGTRRNHRPGLRLTSQIRLGRGTQRLRRRCLGRRTGPRGRARRSRNAGHAGSGWPWCSRRRAGSRARSRDGRRSLWRIAQSGGHGLSRSR